MYVKRISEFKIVRIWIYDAGPYITIDVHVLSVEQAISKIEALVERANGSTYDIAVTKK
jgi:hypothetical protein